MTEAAIERDIRSLLYRNRNNPNLLLLNRLHKPPNAPGNIEGTAPLREIVIAAKVKQLVDGKKQLFFMLGTVLRGKTAISGNILEASNLINQHFGLKNDAYLNWEDDQELAKRKGLVSYQHTSGRRNTPGHYNDEDYRIFNAHYVSTLCSALKDYDFVLSDCAHLVDRGDEALKTFTKPREGTQGENSRLDFQTNGVYVTANRDVVDRLLGAAGFREAVLQYPHLRDEIIMDNQRPIPDAPFKIRGGGWKATFEYIRQESNYFGELLSQGTLSAPWLRSLSQLNDPQYHLRFTEEAFAPYLFKVAPMDRFVVVRNRELIDRLAWPIPLPPGYPIIEACNVYNDISG